LKKNKKKKKKISKQKKKKKKIYEQYLKTKKVSSKSLEKIDSKIDKQNKTDVTTLVEEIGKELETYGEEKLSSLASYRSYLRSNKEIVEEDDCTYAKENKVFKVSFKQFSEPSKQCFIKTGINREIDEKKKIPEQTKKTIKFEK